MGSLMLSTTATGMSVLRMMMMTSSLTRIEELIEWTRTTEEFAEHLVWITEHETWKAAAKNEL